MHLLCWNINSILPTIANAKLKYGSWKGFFEEHNLDVLCLQEAKVPHDKLTKELCCVEGYQSFWACSAGKRGYSGVTTYCSTTWAPISCRLDALEEANDHNDADTFDNATEEPTRATWEGEGRVVETDFGPQAFVLINVYVPNAGDRPERPRLALKMNFLKALWARCKSLVAAGREVLLVGDFNVCADEKDVHPRIGLDNAYSKEERELFLSFLAEHSGIFTDTWRRLHPDAADVYTVWDEKTSARAFNQGVRIDFVLATCGLVDKIKKCEILGADVLPPKWSDHAGILVEIDESIAPPEQHAPCEVWVKLNKRFNDPSQRSILSMFKRAAGNGGGPSGSSKGEKRKESTDAAGGEGASGEGKRQKKG